jgi:uncharacterized protein (DUF2267 family)
VVAELTTKWLRRGTHRSVGELIASIQSWIDTWNQEPRPFVWTKTADQILENITRYLQRISNSVPGSPREDAAHAGKSGAVARRRRCFLAQVRP